MWKTSHVVRALFHQKYGIGPSSRRRRTWLGAAGGPTDKMLPYTAVQDVGDANPRAPSRRAAVLSRRSPNGWA